MKFYSLIEGEGITGSAQQLKATTTTMYSCMSITLYNENNRMFGLYHYPAESLNKPIVRNTIIAMINYIEPTNIYFIPAKKGAMDIGSSPEDINQVDLFLIEYGYMAVLEYPERNNGTFVRWHDGALRINVTPDDGIEPEREGMDELSQNPQAAGRQLGSFTYYGGQV